MWWRWVCVRYLGVYMAGRLTGGRKRGGYLDARWGDLADRYGPWSSSLLYLRTHVLDAVAAISHKLRISDEYPWLWWRCLFRQATVPYLSLATTLWAMWDVVPKRRRPDRHGARPSLFSQRRECPSPKRKWHTPPRCRSITTHTLLFSKRFHIQPARESKHQPYGPYLPKQAWRLSNKEREGKGKDRKAMPSKPNPQAHERGFCRLPLVIWELFLCLPWNSATPWAGRSGFLGA